MIGTNQPDPNPAAADVCLPVEIERNGNAVRQARFRTSAKGRAAYLARLEVRRKATADRKMKRRQGLYMTFDGRAGGVRANIGKEK